MPVWGGWLMLAMGVVLGWVIGDPLGRLAQRRATPPAPHDQPHSTT